MKSPSLFKVAVVIVTVWIIFLYQQYLHTASYEHVKSSQYLKYGEFDPKRHTPICRDNITSQSKSQITQRNDLDTGSQADDQDKGRQCRREFDRVTVDMPDHVPGLTEEDYERSIAHVGNRHRIAAFVQKLIQSTTTTATSTASSNSTDAKDKDNKKALTVVVCGGSITMGHGTEPQSARYSDILEMWMNDAYPVAVEQKNSTASPNKDQNNNQLFDGNYNFRDDFPNRHRVYMRGGHGANICSMAKRLNYLILPRKPDMFILEFAVNDYQAEDQHTFLDHKTDVYFDGFEKFVECTEIVIGRLLTQYPDVAILFLDMHSAVPNRKTAQSLHVGVAQHYQIPVLSYGDVMMPDYFRLLETLKPYQYSIPSNMKEQLETDFPFPHGCAPCRLNDMTEQFRVDGCWSLCSIMKAADIYQGSYAQCDKDPNMVPCYVPMFDHDEVHPSNVGHKIVRDLIIHLLARVVYDLCQGRSFTPHLLPIHGGWMVAASSSDQSYMTDLLALSDYVTVQDIKKNFADTEELFAKDKTNGFAIVDDALGRKGWIATSSSGGESITFAVRVPKAKCYAVYLTILKSYKTVGKFTVAVFDTTQNKTTKSFDVDCLWGPKISVPVDIELTKDGSTDCTGKCHIIVTTHPEIEGRGGNLIKITSLSARRCIG